jgi:LysM repeat protein
VKRLAWVAVLAAYAAPARAQGDDAVWYRVREGDTLELISAELYGDRAEATWIASENKLKKGKQVHAGDRIKVPVTREIVTSRGDTFESLAAAYLGDASRAPYLAEANSMSIEDGLATGTTVTIPLHVTHVASATETLASVAQLYLGDGKQAALLQKLNGLDKTTLDKGDSVLVLGIGLRAKPGKLAAPDAEARARREHQKRSVAAVAAALPRARAAWYQGDFAAVKAVLAPLGDDLEYVDAHTAVDAALLLGKAHVAFGENDAAIAAFTQVLNRRPRYVLAAYAVSPKVIAAWQKAGGHVDSE